MPGSKIVRRSVALSILLLAACSNSSQQSASGSFAAVYPSGILSFKNPTVAFNAGVYAGATERSCCFLRQRAHVTLDRPSTARIAEFHFFVPKVAAYNDGQSVTVSADGTSATGAAGAGKWIVISLALPSSDGSQGAVPVDIVTSKTFVPKDVGLSNDTRELGVVLQRVEYH